MTRSEMEAAVDVIKSHINTIIGNGSQWELNAIVPIYTNILSLLLAEQKRAAGCLYCNCDMVDGYALENMNGKYPKIIGLARKNWRSGDQSKIHFCPNCGRDLTEGESV